MNVIAFARIAAAVAAIYAIQKASPARAALEYATWSGYAQSGQDALGLFGEPTNFGPPGGSLPTIPITGTIWYDNDQSLYQNGHSSAGTAGATAYSGTSTITPSLLTMTVTVNGVTTTMQGGYQGIVAFWYAGGIRPGALEESTFSVVTTSDYSETMSLDLWDLGPPYRLNPTLGLAQDFTLTDPEFALTGQANGGYPGCASGYCTSASFAIVGPQGSSGYSIHLTQFTLSDGSTESVPEPSLLTIFLLACAALGFIHLRLAFFVNFD